MVCLQGASPRVSVVMTAYNVAPYVREAVESILAQTYQDFEFLIVDDGSTDATLDEVRAAARHDPRVAIIEQEHLGIPRSLNHGMSLARGDYIARQDADDISLPDRLAKQIAYLDAHPDIAAVGSVAQVIGANGSHLRYLRVPLKHKDIRARLPSEICFLHGSLLIRRAALDAVGGYRTEFPVSEDYDLYLRLSERYRVANLAEPLYRYRAGTDRISIRARALEQYYHDIALDLARQRREEGRDLLMLGAGR